MSKLRDAAQQALEALEWADNAMYEGTPIQANTQKAITALRAALAEPAEQEPVAWPHVWGCRANAFGECDKGCTAPQPAAVPAEHAIEAAYWDFDARHKGYGPHKTMPQSERDAFKWAVRAMLAAAIRAMKDKT